MQFSCHVSTLLVRAARRHVSGGVSSEECLILSILQGSQQLAGGLSEANTTGRLNHNPTRKRGIHAAIPRLRVGL